MQGQPKDEEDSSKSYTDASESETESVSESDSGTDIPHENETLPSISRGADIPYMAGSTGPEDTLALVAMGTPQQTPPPAAAAPRQEVEEWERRRDFCEAVMNNCDEFVTLGAAGDSLARRIELVLGNWLQYPERRFDMSGAAGTLLGKQPQLRVALCVTCLKRDDQLKQTLPTLCMFMARIRPARSSAHLRCLA